jgi:hypothetical protein
VKLTRRSFLAALAAAVSLVVSRAAVGHHKPGHGHGPPSPTPSPSPTTTATATPTTTTTSPPPTEIFGPIPGRAAIVAGAGARPVVAPAGGILFTSAADLQAKIAASP